MIKRIYYEADLYYDFAWNSFKKRLMIIKYGKIIICWKIIRKYIRIYTCMFETSHWMQIRGGNKRTAPYAAPYASPQAILLIMTIGDGAMFQDYSR